MSESSIDEESELVNSHTNLTLADEIMASNDKPNIDSDINVNMTSGEIPDKDTGDPDENTSNPDENTCSELAADLVSELMGTLSETDLESITGEIIVNTNTDTSDSISLQITDDVEAVLMTALNQIYLVKETTISEIPNYSAIDILNRDDQIVPAVDRDEEIAVLSGEYLITAGIGNKSGLPFSYDQWTHRIYCVSLATSTKRRDRIKRRFAYHGLLKWLTFIDAIPTNSPLIDVYGEDVIYKPINLPHQRRATLSCFASHLKAIRTYLEDPLALISKGAIICEDDVLLHNNWSDQYKAIMTNKPLDANVIMFTYILDKWEGTQWVGQDASKENLFKLPHNFIWGTQMYWISLQQSMRVLGSLDRPFKQLAAYNPITSELITRLSEPVLAYPPLALEDCTGSFIRDKHAENSNLQFFGPWGYSNYSGGDDDGEHNPESRLFTFQQELTNQRPSPPPPSPADWTYPKVSDSS